MSVGKRIKQRREELGLTQEAVAKKVGVAIQTIYKYENEIVTNIPLDKLEKIAEALNIRPDYLMGWSAARNNSETVSLSAFDNIMPIKTYKLPLIGTIACGTPILAEQNIEEYIETDSTVKADFCLRCKGDSMINVRIFDGDIVYIRQQPDVENGEIAAVCIDDEATLKRVYKYPNRLELRPENPMFPVLNYEGSELENIRIIGKAVAFLSGVR